MLVEAVAQLAGIAAIEKEGEGGFLAMVDQAVFGRPPCIGDTLDVFVRIIRSFGRLRQVEGHVTVDGMNLLDITLSIGIGPL